MHETQPPWLQAPADAVARWRNLTFGLFIHWDPSSVLGVEISWARQSRAGFGHGFIPDDVYDALPASFHPAQSDARAIARTARNAGMRYLVFTAKHHAGFAMYETTLSDHNITRTPFGRDVLREIADATRSEGLAFGIYFSQPDWRHPAFVARDFAAFRPFVVGQLTELLTRYGPVDILFFDGLGCSPGDYDASNLFRTIRELQPSIIINDRCGLPGDYASPEQVVGAFRRDRPWESCITLGTQWSWKPQDTLKSAHDCIRTLVSTAGGGGNLLLNVGPMPAGGVEERQVAVL